MTNIVKLVEDAKKAMRELSAVFGDKIVIMDDSFYQEVTPIYEESENQNPNKDKLPIKYRISFTNDKNIVITSKRYNTPEVSNALAKLKSCTERVKKEQARINYTMNMLNSKNAELKRDAFSNMRESKASSAAGIKYRKQKTKKQKTKKQKTKKQKTKKQKTKKQKTKKRKTNKRRT